MAYTWIGTNTHTHKHLRERGKFQECKRMLTSLNVFGKKVNKKQRVYEKKLKRVREKEIVIVCY